jgi:predicted Zn-dependent protease
MDTIEMTYPVTHQTNPSSHLEHCFFNVVGFIAQACPRDAHFTMTLNAEDSHFLRFNRAKVRQVGHVQDGMAKLTLIQNGRSAYWEFPLTGEESDIATALAALAALQSDLPLLPINPYLVIPSGNQRSQETSKGVLLPVDGVAQTILGPVRDLDFTGIYCGGQMIRGYADSVGQRHWFATDTYSLDYSIFTPAEQALKGTIAGSHWNGEAYLQQIQSARQLLRTLDLPVRQVKRGQYRTYFAPAAVAEIASMLSWGGVSESSLRQGGSCFAPMRRDGKRLSEKLSFGESFAQSLVPRFNELGEVAPTTVPIINHGALEQLLISSATAKEYGVVANGANRSETLRALEISAGDLPTKDILSVLGTGLYVSNLHYLNWSDRPTGRITGMTRYACFWVEEGEIIAPIEHLRFDDSLYRFWGENLVGLTDQVVLVPEVGTYGSRSLGGIMTPGMVVNNFTYTL